MTFAVKEGESNVVARGKPVFYNVTFGVPYRTVSDIFVQIQSAVPEVQVSVLPVCAHVLQELVDLAPNVLCSQMAGTVWENVGKTDFLNFEDVY